MTIIELLSKNNTFTILPTVIILKIKEFINNEYLTKEEKEIFIKKDYSDFIKFNLNKLKEETNKFKNDLNGGEITIENIYYLNNIIKNEYNFVVSVCYTEEEEEIFGEDMAKELDYLLDNYYEHIHLELKATIKHKKDEKKYLKDIVDKNKFLKDIIIYDIKQDYTDTIDVEKYPDWPYPYTHYEIKEDEDDSDYYIVYFELELFLKHIKNEILIKTLFTKSNKSDNKLTKKSNNENNNIIKKYIREIYRDILCVMIKLD
jgi:hypothetical protein